ncbi:MAG: ribonuclease P protein component [Candidatus Omnitrophica bacterium]|nr:ribonuclease P protein component [Candidatus Omnitrophota bacterium]MCM8791397.1 ribonuclease P protein component [Candidatus Omnitrophota bacterium]
MISDGDFRKKERILKTRDFRIAYKKGRSLRKDGLVLYFLANGLSYNRVGFSISSSTVKLATLRNRIRRLFREVYRRKKTSMKTAFDIILIVRKNPGKATSYKWAEETFSALLKQAGIML